MIARAILLALLPVICAGAAQAAPDENTLCFVSLNNSKEFELTRAFLEKANRSAGSGVRVVEFHNPAHSADPEISFREMVEGRHRCDGLVISGHHTGSFGGSRAKGVLDVSFLEELSCEPQNSEFFNNIKAVWLQGCRTLGVGPINPGEGNATELQADYHMQRVGAELLQDGLSQSFADLSFEFSAILDQDNPLASRYMRVFPAASVFGWTKSSPGQKSGSEKSLLYHMSHMVHISQDVALFDPLKKSSASINSDMSRSLQFVLEGDASREPLARNAWLSHGRVRTNGLGFDNPDLNAHAPLLSSSREDLLEAKAMGCAVRNSRTFDQLQAALGSVLRNPYSVGHNLNVIWQAFEKYGGEDTAQYSALRAQLLDSEPLMTLLRDKLTSPRTGLLMKIEYYSFYNELTGITNKDVEALILRHAHYFLLAPDLAGSAYDIRDFRESLLTSVNDHGLADNQFYRQVVQAPEADSTTLYALSWFFVKESPPEAGLLIADIVNDPRVESGALKGAALWIMYHGSNEHSVILASIVAHPAADEETLGIVATVFARQDYPVSPKLLQEIVAHPNTGSLALSQATLAIGGQSPAVTMSLLDDILSHPRVDEWGVQNVARVISSSDLPPDPQLMEKIIGHKQVSPIALNSLAISLGQSSFEGQSEALHAIRDHPRADTHTLSYVERAIARSDASEREEEFY